MAQYNGWQSWNAWNINLHMTNDEFSYRYLTSVVAEYTGKYGKIRGTKLAARHLANIYEGCRTPDGARYTLRSLQAVCEAEAAD